MKKVLILIASVVVGGLLYAAQDTGIENVEVRDPKRLEIFLEANASDAETRIAALEGGSTVGAVEPGYIIVGNASTVGVDVAVSGDITMANDGTAAIASGVIVNADVNASAAIALTKLAPVAPAYIIVGNATSQAVAVAVSGDLTNDNAGAYSIESGTLSTNVIIGTVYTNTFVFRTLTSGVIVVESITQDAI